MKINKNEFNILAMQIIRSFDRQNMWELDFRGAKKFLLKEITSRGKYNYSQTVKYTLMLEIIKRLVGK